jgi:hypothetical protein
MTGAIGMDPYAVLGVLVEGAVQTLIEQIPAERQAGDLREIVAKAAASIALERKARSSSGSVGDRLGQGHRSWRQAPLLPVS